MSILIVGNVIKDVYLNLDQRTEHFETDQHDTKWLNLSFDASEHHYYNRSSNFGGATISFEVLNKLQLDAAINGFDLQFTEDGFSSSTNIETYRYILINDEKPCYFVPTAYKTTHFTPPANPYDYLYVDRSAELDQTAANGIQSYLKSSPNTKLVLYVRNFNNSHLNSLLSQASLIFLESDRQSDNHDYSSYLNQIDSAKIVHISEHCLSHQSISEPISVNRIDTLTHLSAYSIASATVLGSFILGHPIEDSLRFSRINLEYSKLNSTLELKKIQALVTNTNSDNLELIAKNLVLYPKGILAADESGGSINKKFAGLNIPDTYNNRRDYRNIFFTTPHLEHYVNGIILFDETAHQLADNGQNFVDYLTAKRIIPGIKVDQGLVPLEPNSPETITKGLDHLPERLANYYQFGLRFAKWRAAFEIRLNHHGNLLTPTDNAIKQNCQILAKYASDCQAANIVPIVEPEIVHAGYYSLDTCATTTAKILDQLFVALHDQNVNLRACILKVNMVLAGQYYETQSTPTEVGQATADVLRAHVPNDLAGVVFLSGGQTYEQATNNLAEIIKHGPFPWPVTFSFARALQDPALYAWQGDNSNTEKARQAFADRLIANTNALKTN